MKPYENLNPIGVQFPEEPEGVNSAQAIVRLYYLFSKWLESGCPVTIYQMQAPQPQTQPEPPAGAAPPDEIKQLMQLLFARYEGRPIPPTEQVVEAKDIPPSILGMLNAFASQVARRECKIKAVFGGSSCTADGMAGNLVVTDCGNQCWNCGGASW